MEKLKTYIKNLMVDKNAKYSFFLNFNHLIVLIAIIMLMTFISGQIPGLHNIAGYVFHKDSLSQSQSGTKVRLLLNSSGNIINILTSGPPGYTGFYSTNLNASDGENITVTAFNATSFGRNVATLLSYPSTTRLNLTLNNTRPAETRIVITSPNNGTEVNNFLIFNLNFNLYGIGGENSTDCNVSIFFDREDRINTTFYENKIKYLGNISLGSSMNGSFQLETKGNGLVNINLSSSCSSDSENFDNLNVDYLTLEILSIPPELHSIQGYVFQSNNITQVPSGTNVTINATITGSFISILTSGPPGHSGFFSTTINARNGETVIVRAENDTYYGIKNISLLNSSSTTRLNLSLNTEIVESPIINYIVVDDDISTPANEIDLNVASTKLVNCSGNLTDSNGYMDIENVTAIFYDSNNASLNSPDDNNNHYTNNSCTLNNCSEDSCKFDCTFNVEYYANANMTQSWNCSVTATDNSNNKGYGNDIVSINTLLGVEFPDTINFGTVGNNKVSNESSNNITNRGNVKIDISLDGYGSYDGDGNAMNCSNGNNISIGYEKYNLTSSNVGDLSLTQFSNLYKNLTDNPENETGFNLEYRREDTSDYIDDSKLTFWRIFVPGGISVGTSCGGNINIRALVDI